MGSRITKIISCLLFLGMTLSLPLKVWAVDLTVTCDGQNCQMSPYSGAVLFYEEDLKPSYNIPRQFSVINNGEEDCDLTMGTKNEADPDNLAPVLFTVIDSNLGSFFGSRSGSWQASSSRTLWDLFTAGEVNLGVVPAGETVNYYWAVTMNPEAGNQYQDVTVSFDFDMYFSCGSLEEEPPSLVISKDNDRKGDVLGVGDIVNYEIIVTNEGPGRALNVFVKDVMPVGDYFDYDEHSGHLICSDGTDFDLSATGSNPYYWFLGDMEVDEECKLTYKMEILSIAIPGEHDNLALAYGQGTGGGTYFSEIVIDPVLVGTSQKLSADVEENEIMGTVLGAATSIGEVLGAATGSKTFWLVLSLSFVILGGLLKVLKGKND